MNIDVLCCGMLVADFSFSLTRRPEADEKLVSESFLLTSGGPAANAALTVSLLGGQAEIIASTGKDALGKSLIDDLKNDGFSTDSIIQHDQGLNAAAILSIADGSRNVISQKAAFKPTELPESAKNLSPKVLLFDGHLPELSLKLMKLFPKAITVLDAGSVHQGTIDLYRKVDWLIGSKKFALNLTEKVSLREAFRELDSLAKNTVITDGGSGLLYKDKNKVMQLAAYNVEAVDSNGAGDVFHGAFSYGLAKDFTFEENLKFSSATAAFSCKAKGIRGNIPEASEILNFIKNH